MFRLDEIMKQLKIEAVIIGNQGFDSLGLIGIKQNNRICSYIEDARFIDNISDNVVLIITNREFADSINNKNICIVEDPRMSFFQVHNMLSAYKEYRREPRANDIGANCRISKDARLDSSNIIIGDNVVIEEFVTIRNNTIIGDNSIIKAGVRIGEEGFEFKKGEKELFYVNHVGGVIIGKSTRIMHNTSVDKAVYPWDNTIISDGCIVSSQVQISHSVKLNERVTVASNSFIGGRTEVDRDTWIGPGTVISNGLKIGIGSRVSIGSVVTKDVLDSERVSGNFAIDHNKFIEHIRNIR